MEMNSETLIVGIDPGVSGALAFWWPVQRKLQVHDTPVFNTKRASGTVRAEIDPTGLALLLDGVHVSHAFIERVGAMPKQGTVSVFNFGTTYGVLLGCLGANFVPVTRVTPPEWKRFHRLPSGASKDDSRAAASRLIPEFAHLWPLKKHDGRAESALIALWGEAFLNREAGA